MEKPCRDEGGFSLVELIIVVGMLGVVMTAIYSLYSTHQKTAFSQAEVVDVQQNLRVAMDTISRDIRMAGVMIPAGPNQTFAAPAGSPAFPNYTSSIRINTASAEGRFARVATQYQVPSGAPAITLTVEAPATAASPNIVDGFAVNDNVRIVRPVDGSQPLSSAPLMTVTTTDRTVNAITLGGTFTAADTLVPGDMIVKIGADGAYPMTVDYYLVGGGVTVNGYTCPNNQQCLVRRVNGSTADIIATNLSSIQFRYLTDSLAEQAVPTDLTKIRAVRVTLQGATSKTVAMSGAAKSRTLTSIVKLRNRR